MQTTNFTKQELKTLLKELRDDLTGTSEKRFDDQKKLFSGLENQLKSLEKRQNTKFNDIRGDIKALNSNQLRLEVRIENLEEDTKILKSDSKLIKQKLDKTYEISVDLVGKVDDLNTENTVGAYQTRKLREEFGTLEKRVQKLEKTESPS